jgi:hypothetical protein
LTFVSMLMWNLVAVTLAKICDSGVQEESNKGHSPPASGAPDVTPPVADTAPITAVVQVAVAGLA